MVPALDHAKLLDELAKDPLALGHAATNWAMPLLAVHLRRQGYPVSARTLRRRLVVPLIGGWGFIRLSVTQP